MPDFILSGHIEWKDKGRKQCLIMWRTPEEWGNIIYNWVSVKVIPREEFRVMESYTEVCFQDKYLVVFVPM